MDPSPVAIVLKMGPAGDWICGVAGLALKSMTWEPLTPGAAGRPAAHPALTEDSA